MKESRQDNEGRYRREERRLKQKYRNLLQNLKHEQKVELHTLALNF